MFLESSYKGSTCFTYVGCPAKVTIVSDKGSEFVVVNSNLDEELDNT